MTSYDDDERYDPGWDYCEDEDCAGRIVEDRCRRCGRTVDEVAEAMRGDDEEEDAT